MNECAHLLLSDLAITARHFLPFQSLDPPFERIAERTSVRDEVFQLCRVSLSDDFISNVDGSRVKLRDAGDVIVE